MARRLPSGAIATRNRSRPGPTRRHGSAARNAGGRRALGSIVVLGLVVVVAVALLLVAALSSLLNGDWKTVVSVEGTTMVVSPDLV